jgi:ubiquitin-conjugating enzyme E2 S
MLTKIFHPNISNAGEICVNTLKRDWTPEHTLAHVLVTIKCLLIYPNAESALDEEAGRLLLEEYEAYCSRARLVTSVHARGRPAEFGPVPTAAAAPAASTASSSAAPVVAPTLSAPVTRSQSARIVSSENGPDGAAAKVVAVDVVASMKTRHASPAPLGTADGNANAGAGPDGTLGSGVPVLAAKAIKRAAAPGASGVEKRKKALKRL